MNLVFRKSQIEDLDELLYIQKLSFKEDLEKYKDYETNPACETYEKLLDNIKKFHHFTILENDEIIGAMDIRGNDDRMHIDKIFISPNIQNSGIGTKSMNYLESIFPDVKLWTLYTPHLSFRNHHFYEKFNYKKIKEVQINSNLILFKYEKRCNGNSFT